MSAVHAARTPAPIDTLQSAIDRVAFASTMLAQLSRAPATTKALVRSIEGFADELSIAVDDLVGMSGIYGGSE